MKLNMKQSVLLRLLALVFALALLLTLPLLSLPAQAAYGNRYVALTFDDGPSGRFTRQLLNGLETRDAKATFFLCGYRLEIYPELAKQIHDAGHEIGLHGYSHTDMATLSRKDLQKEIPGSIYCPTLPEVTEYLRSVAGPGDVILTVGAGDIYRAGEAMLK